MPRQVRENAADPAPALPMTAEHKRTLEDVAGHGGDGLDALAVAFEAPAVPRLQEGLIIEGVDLAGAPVHEKLEDAPGPRAMVHPAIQTWRRSCRGKMPVAPEQVQQRDAAEAAPELP